MLERTHVVQTISQLDHDDADVIYHRQHHLAQVLRLRFFGRRKIDLADLRYALDNVRHLLAKFLPDFDRRNRSVLD